MSTETRPTSKALIEAIKSRGHWRVLFRPLRFNATRIPSLSKCEEVVEKASVSLRGWSYPHIPRRAGPTFVNDYVEGATDSGAYKELWRLYQSGQFVHLDSLKEDWMKEDSWFANNRREPGEVLEIINTVYTVTELFEFLSRLARLGIYKEGVEVSVGLHNTEGRRLAIFDRMRAPLHGEYRCMSPDIVFERTLTEPVAIQKSKDTALEALIHFVERFNWKNPPVEIIRADQQRLLEGRL